MSFTWCLAAEGFRFMVVILWTINRGLDPFLLKNLHHLGTWCMDANLRLLSFWNSTEILALFYPYKNFIANSRLFPSGTQPRFWTFCRYLVHPPIQNTYARKLSDWVLSSNLQISCPFFQGALPLAALLISWRCYKSFFQVAVSVILFVLSLCSISNKNYLSPETIKSIQIF